MTINKRLPRNLRKDLSFYLCTLLLTVLMVVLYLSFVSLGKQFGGKVNELYEKGHLEDAQFTLVNDIPDENIDRLQDEYDIIIEKQEFIDLEDEAFCLRLYKNSSKLNIAFRSEGEDPKKDGEILLNTGFLNARDLKISDEIKVKGETFEIKGTNERPDQLFPLKEYSDTFVMREKFGLGEITEDAFERLKEAKGVSIGYYSIKYNKDNEDSVRKKINEDYTMTSYIKAENNARIKTVKSEIDQSVKLVSSVVAVFAVFMAVLTSVVIGRKIRGDKKQLGVLLALGYKKRTLASHYAFYGLLPGLLGSIIGIITALFLSGRFISLLFSKVEPLPLEVSFMLSDYLMMLLIPASAYVIAVFITAMSVMKTDVITMITGRSSRTGKNRLRMKKVKFSLKTKYRLRQMVGKPSRTLMVLIGIAMSGMLFSFCLTCIDSMDLYVKETVDQIGSFEYEYFLKGMRQGSPDKGSAILGGSFETDLSEEQLILFGIDDPDYINFESPSGEKISYDKDSYYLTSMASLAFDVKAGESLKFSDPISLKEYEIKIDAIIKNDSQAAVYCSRENAAKLMDLPSDLYNIIMSDEELDLSEDDLAKTISKTSLADQINEVKIHMEDVTWAMTLIAVIICVLVIYMMVNLLITESAPSISMLKVLGYRNGEINSLLVNSYHLLVPIAIAISLLLGFFATKMTFDSNVAVYRTYLKTVIYPASIIKTAALIIATYFLSLLLLKGKVGRTELVESLKDNRE